MRDNATYPSTSLLYLYILLPRNPTNPDGGERDPLDPEAGSVDAARPHLHVLVAGEQQGILIAVSV